MGIFNDLGFKKRNGIIVAPDAEKLGGYTLDEVKSQIKPTFVNVGSGIISKANITAANLPATLHKDSSWIQYTPIAYNFSDNESNPKKLIINDIEQIIVSEILNSVSTEKVNDILHDSSCIATYNLDENTNSVSGTNNCTSSGITYAPGKFGNAASFNGSNSKIVIPNNLIGNSNSSFSVSGWICPSVIKLQPFIAFGGYANGLGVGMLSTGELVVGYVKSGSLTQIKTSYAANTNEWYHLVLTFNSTTKVVSFYVNNILVGTSTNLVGDGGTPDGIGYSSQSPITVQSAAIAFNGLIDQVRFFNKEISENEVDILNKESTNTLFTTFGTILTNDQDLKIKVEGNIDSLELNFNEGV